jgi:hypothetical protein
MIPTSVQIAPATITHAKLATIPVKTSPVPLITTTAPKIFLDFDGVIFRNVEVAT